MNSGEVQVQVERQAAELDMIARRNRTQIILLNEDFSVALADWDAGSEVLEKLGLTRSRPRLQPEAEKSVRAVVDALLKDPASSNLLMLHESIVLRVSMLASDAAAMIVLFVEPSRRREDLSSAAKRYNLTQRQVEVLGYILQGYSAREIAAALCISDTTVSDHFKALLLRTAARNRADMVARVLNWTERREAPTNPLK
jgi:DNA-binding NarL/FixJ family response regulator